ncbi:MAG: DUF2125 domain-containing protein [Devosia sp.]
MNRFVALGVVVAIIVVLWSGAWFWAAGTATAYVKALETADGVSTPQVKCLEFSITGFPFGFDATCRGASILLEDTSVTLAGLKASVLVYNPFHVLAFAQSPATYNDALWGIRRRLDFADAEASARLTDWRIGRVSVVVNQPVLTDIVVEDRPIGKAAKAEFHLIDVPAKHDTAAGLASLAEYVAISGLSAPGFEIANGEATFEAEISNLPDDVRVYGDADLAKRWQAAGGRFNIVALKAGDGDTKLESSGTLGLDAQGRVEGQVKLTSSGVVERLGDEVPAELKGLLLGAQAKDGSYSQTINIAAGIVFAGLFPATIVPPLW